MVDDGALGAIRCYGPHYTIVAGLFWLPKTSSPLSFSLLLFFASRRTFEPEDPASGTSLSGRIGVSSSSSDSAEGAEDQRSFGAVMRSGEKSG